MKWSGHQPTGVTLHEKAAKWSSENAYILEAKMMGTTKEGQDIRWRLGISEFDYDVMLMMENPTTEQVAPSIDAL